MQNETRQDSCKITADQSKVAPRLHAQSSANKIFKAKQSSAKKVNLSQEQQEEEVTAVVC